MLAAAAGNLQMVKFLCVRQWDESRCQLHRSSICVFMYTNVFFVFMCTVNLLYSVRLLFEPGVIFYLVDINFKLIPTQV